MVAPDFERGGVSTLWFFLITRLCVVGNWQEALSARTFSQIVLYMMTQCEMLLDEV